MPVSVGYMGDIGLPGRGERPCRQSDAATCSVRDHHGGRRNQRTRRRGDGRHLVRAGLIGGKGIDESVTARPAVLLTLTAPSFGLVHSAKPGGPCRPSSPTARCPHGQPLSCFRRHTDHESVVGSMPSICWPTARPMRRSTSRTNRRRGLANPKVSYVRAKTRFQSRT